MYVAIAGNIGSGKSSLTRLVSERYGLEPVFEAVDENPYLADFYEDMTRYGFHSQVFDIVGMNDELEMQAVLMPAQPSMVGVFDDDVRAAISLDPVEYLLPGEWIPELRLRSREFI